MNRFWNPISLALILLSLLWGAVPSFAQATNYVAFRASWVGMGTPTAVPTEPGLVTQTGVITGTADAWGAFTGVSLGTIHQGVDGSNVWVFVEGQFNMPNGDGLNFQQIVVFVPPTPGGPGAVAALIITNGKGHYLGAKGNGFLTSNRVVDPVTGQAMQVNTATGVVSKPLP